MSEIDGNGIESHRLTMTAFHDRVIVIVKTDSHFGNWIGRMHGANNDPLFEHFSNA